jgi:hypothetical protein
MGRPPSFLIYPPLCRSCTPRLAQIWAFLFATYALALGVAEVITLSNTLAQGDRPGLDTRQLANQGGSERMGKSMR